MKEISSSPLGDSRLEKAFALLVTRMVVRYTVTLRKMADNRNEEIRFGRFINNSKVNPKGLLKQSSKLPKSDLLGKHILVVSDTCTLSFNRNNNRTDLGFVGRNTIKSGFEIHPSILLDAADGGCYGVGGIHIHKTEFSDVNACESVKRARNLAQRKLLYEDKANYKWLDSPKQAILNYPGATSYTLVGDRDSDIYDLMGRTLENKWHFVYRSKSDRLLSSDHNCSKIYEQIDQWPIKHSYELYVQQTKERTAHKAKMDLKFGQLTILRPEKNKDQSLVDQIRLQVVQAEERAESVVGNEERIRWVLLTSHPVETFEDALQIIQWYLWRWVIEQLFRTLKSKGLKIEASEVETFEALANLATLALLAACQIMQLVQAREGATTQQKEHVFTHVEAKCITKLNTKLEGKTKKLKNPHPPDSLAFASWVIARLGGWSGYQSQRPPGPITMTEGLTQFYTMMQGVYLIL